MNDFERHLAAQPFRTPPADLRAAILAATPAASWRDWLWPSPLAWAALALIWVALYAVEAPARNAARASAAVRADDREIPRQAVLAFALDHDRLLAEIARNRLSPGP